ncbi:DUF3969 family protein [Paenibacillus sp. JNUCC31]|uniref:DUF3969 family protein n=1 Tax=Paenibacillus sp. JNUCC-31 TaxID=2777983 RepID=UPI00177D0E14|nr:DUF3969 family protein [Paenibacillus sp. JNUCC-31]QOS80851.1 DUF3969 family protein [Paenibacillus sp. JNUCC-31]
MELNLRVSGKVQIERIVSILELGMLTALEEGVVNLEEIEGYLFNPFTADILEGMTLSNEVIEIIKSGCELEDVESLMPQKLQSTISELKEETINTLRQLPAPNIPTEKLLNDKSQAG